MTPLRVVIADDQPMMRAGFKAVLEATGDIHVVAEASTGAEAVSAATEPTPDVVLMDIRMPGMDGIEATRRLPRQRVLILTTLASTSTSSRRFAQAPADFCSRTPRPRRSSPRSERWPPETPFSRRR